MTSSLTSLRLADLEAGERDATEFTRWQEEMKQVLYQEIGNDFYYHILSHSLSSGKLLRDWQRWNASIFRHN